MTNMVTNTAIPAVLAANSRVYMLVAYILNAFPL